jgi:hypothetical protein
VRDIDHKPLPGAVAKNDEAVLLLFLNVFTEWTGTQFNFTQVRTYVSISTRMQNSYNPIKHLNFKWNTLYVPLLSTLKNSAFFPIHFL